jgi:hypothetical protein
MFTNPNPNLHIDLLKSQYAVFEKVWYRYYVMVETDFFNYRKGRTDKPITIFGELAYRKYEKELKAELVVLHDLIKRIENEKSK